MVCCDRPPTHLTQEQLFNQQGARPQEWQTFSVRFIPSWDCRYQNNHSLIVRPETKQLRPTVQLKCLLHVQYILTATRGVTLPAGH